MRHPLQICLVTSTFAPVIGGAETYALTFADGMSNRGHRVTVVTDGWDRARRPAGDRLALDAGRPFRVVRLAEYAQLFGQEGVIPWEVLAFGLLPELERALADAEFDVVVTNSLDSALTGKLLALARSIPWAATFHEQAPAAQAFGDARLQLVYQVLRPDLVLAGSEMYAARARAHDRTDATVRILHGIDTQRFHPGIDQATARQRRRIPADALVVLCVARLTPRKGIPDLLQAFARIVPRWPRAYLVVAGTVNSSDRVHAEFLNGEVSRLGLGGHVSFDETAQPDDMPWLFAAADLVVQPSHAEGLGLAVLEGMGSGRAVVATDIPATREITQGEDVLVMCPPGDVETLADAIEALLLDPACRARLAAAGRQHVLQRFSRDAMLEHTEAALLSLASGDRSGEVR